jgi:hypothetical protein
VAAPLKSLLDARALSGNRANASSWASMVLEESVVIEARERCLFSEVDMTHSLSKSHIAVFVLLIGLVPWPALAQLAWMNTDLSPEARAELLLDAMTLDQKIGQMQTVPSPNDELEGCGFQPLGRHVEGIPELAIPTVRAINGGNGMRGGDCLPEPTATALPSATLSAATFNRSINLAWGAVLGQEARDFAHHAMLGPGLNLIRHPYSGRAQEYMSEDPFLAGVTATEQVRGIQSRGTQAMIKHFATNEDEGEISNAGRRRPGCLLAPCTSCICSPSRWRSRLAAPHR